MTDSNCTTHGWSVITSAATHSQLAGVLAGFLFTGVVLLFGRKGVSFTQTIALFTATFFILALDSYQYSLIAGNVPAQGKFDIQCPYIWSQMMPAAGSLAVGAVALACGMSWLLTGHVEASTKSSNARMGRSRRSKRTPAPSLDRTLNKLAAVVVVGMIIGAMLLLLATTLDYFEAVYGTRPITLSALTFGIGTPLMICGAALTTWRTRRWVRTDAEPAHPRHLLAAAYFTVIYGLACLAATGLLSVSGVDSSAEISNLNILVSFLLGLVAPGVGIGVLLAGSVPSSENSEFRAMLRRVARTVLVHTASGNERHAHTKEANGDG